MESINNVAKFCALFLIRFRTQGDRSGSLTAVWLNVRTSQSPRANPSHIRAIPQTLEYLRIYLHEWSYMERHREAEPGRAFKQTVSDTLRTMSTAVTKAGELRIMQLQSVID
jgi:hypothetical protein